MLGHLKDVLISVKDADQAAADYREHLQYEILETGTIDEGDSLLQLSPLLAGVRMVTVRPTADDSTSMTFISTPDAQFDSAFRELGWNALEIVVGDVEQLIEDLKDTSFTITAGPIRVDKYPYLTAANAVGPSGEKINFTRVFPYKDDLPRTERCAGKLFIVTLAVKDLPETIAFWQDIFDGDVSDIKHVALGNMNRHLGIPADTRHPIVTVRLGQQTKLEVDEAPDVCVERRFNALGLPAGLSCVTIAVDDPAEIADRLEAAGTFKFYRGSQSTLVVGPSGELIKLEGN